MSFSKRPTQPPGFDAGTAIQGMSLAWQRFPEWKRWVEATGSQDVKGMRDVVNANAIGLDVVKSDVDEHAARIADLEARVHALEVAPPAPFPASS